MTKDYAKRKRAKKKTNTRTPRSNNKKPISPIIVFLSGILLTLFAVFLWAIVKKPDVIKEIVEQKEVGAKNTKSQTETSENTQKESKKEPDTEFTYHETLTNKKVDVVINKPKTTDSDKTYIMQCGAFKKISDAEKMKAELAFIGFQANILSKGDWHRVRLGPYKSKRTAESDRHKLQDNKYLNCQIW
ncbi:SPOR domain-containing protein [Kangiella japonica]|uniref:SPOR domain-containing protein n=1 Tax=Kangiella japonica TaxID=647384 RepID=A0ABN0SXI5_9GAMM